MQIIQIEDLCVMCGQKSTMTFVITNGVHELYCDNCKTMLSRGEPAKAKYDAEIAKQRPTPHIQRAGRVRRVHSVDPIEPIGMTLEQQKQMIRNMKAAIEVMNAGWNYMVQKNVHEGIMSYKEATDEFHARTDFFEQLLQ